MVLLVSVKILEESFVIFTTIVLINSHCSALDKIVGGVNAELAEFPFIVPVTTAELFCAGSIIEDRWILTAAHCSQNPPSKYTVITGVYDLKQINENNKYEVDKIFVHSNYKSGGANDIALMRLTKSIKFSEKAQKISLPEKGSNVDGQVRVCGWGLDSEHGTASKILQKVTISIEPNYKCVSKLVTLAHILGLMREDNFICAGGNDHSACYGDSGGPLLSFSPTTLTPTYTLTGIVSSGRVCGGPGLYVRVASYLDWIQEIISKNSDE